MFSTKFYLHFNQLSKDTCDGLREKSKSSDGEEIKTAEIEKKTHLEEAERTSSQITIDRMTIPDKKIRVFFYLKKASRVKI